MRFIRLAASRNHICRCETCFCLSVKNAIKAAPRGPKHSIMCATVSNKCALDLSPVHRRLSCTIFAVICLHKVFALPIGSSSSTWSSTWCAQCLASGLPPAIRLHASTSAQLLCPAQPCHQRQCLSSPPTMSALTAASCVCIFYPADQRTTTITEALFASMVPQDAWLGPSALYVWYWQHRRVLSSSTRC